MYLKIRDRLGYMSNTSSNFEMAGVLLGKEVRKRKNTSGKNRNYSTDYGARYDGVPRGAFAWNSAQSVV